MSIDDDSKEYGRKYTTLGRKMYRTLTLTRTASLGQPNMSDVDVQTVSCTGEKDDE